MDPPDSLPVTVDCEIPILDPPANDRSAYRPHAETFRRTTASGKRGLVPFQSHTRTRRDLPTFEELDASAFEGLADCLDRIVSP